MRFGAGQCWIVDDRCYIVQDTSTLSDDNILRIEYCHRLSCLQFDLLKRIVELPYPGIKYSPMS